MATDEQHFDSRNHAIAHIFASGQMEKVYDEINEFNAKQVVHAEPRVSKAVRPTPLP